MIRKIFILGCKGEARAIAHAIKSCGLQPVIWFRPKVYSEHEMIIDKAYSNFLKIRLQSDSSLLEKECLCKYSNALIIISNFRKIDLSLLDSKKSIILNFHNSKLPYYKGIHPVQWQIRDGLKKIYFSIHKVTSEIDSGPVLIRSFINRKRGDDSISIQNKLNGEIYRLTRLLFNSYLNDINRFESWIFNSNFNPKQTKALRQWARKLNSKDNSYNSDDAKTFQDFLDSTPYPFRHHE